MLVEVQIRSRLQHAWATAVEAVGSIQRQEIKAGEGDPDWRRFFALVSCEISDAEGLPLVPGAPTERGDRAKELHEIDGRLNALTSLDQLRAAVHAVTGIRRKQSAAFIVSLVTEQWTVDVQAIAAGASSTAYKHAEQNGRRNSVIVEVDRAEDLRAAYPNYYLDAGDFVSFVRQRIGGNRPTWISMEGLARMLDRSRWRRR